MKDRNDFWKVFVISESSTESEVIIVTESEKILEARFLQHNTPKWQNNPKIAVNNVKILFY